MSIGEVLDRDGRVADELAGRPVQLVALEHSGRLRLDDLEVALAAAEVHVDRRGVHIAVGILVRDEAGDVDVDHDERRTQHLRVARGLLDDARRLARDDPRR